MDDLSTRDKVLAFCEYMRGEGVSLFALYQDDKDLRWKLAGPAIDRNIIAGALRDAADQCELSGRPESVN
jgi:hypothetical protein